MVVTDGVHRERHQAYHPPPLTSPQSPQSEHNYWTPTSVPYPSPKVWLVPVVLKY